MSSNRAGAAGGGAIYGLGIFGAFVYYWQQADSLWEYVFSFIQGLFWPAFMVYEVFSALGSWVCGSVGCGRVRGTAKVRTGASSKTPNGRCGAPGSRDRCFRRDPRPPIPNAAVDQVSSWTVNPATSASCGARARVGAQKRGDRRASQHLSTRLWCIP